MARKASRSLSDGACDAINKVDLHESFVAELLLQGVSDAGCSDVHAKVYHEHWASVSSRSQQTAERNVVPERHCVTLSPARTVRLLPALF